MLLALYVDDLDGIYTASKPLGVLTKLLEDFKRVHSWSIKHQQVFAPAKFHLLNIGKPGRKLRKNAKRKAIYDGTSVQWSRSVKFLGATWDSNLRFVNDIRSMMRKFTGNSWKIWINNNERFGCSINFQLRSFQEHVLSHLLNGSGVWIFALFPHIRLHAKAMRPYTDIWKDFSSSLVDILRKICHARDKTSHIALLVRLGMLPPHYYIASHAMADYFTIMSTDTAPSNRSQCEHLRDSVLWNKSLFYAGRKEILLTSSGGAMTLSWNARHVVLLEGH